MNRRLLLASTAVVGIAIFAGGASLYRAAQPAPEPAAPVAGNTLVRPHSPVFGPDQAPVTIVEFFDPSCEACRAFYPEVKKILNTTNNKVRLVLRYTPLHNGSDEAVRILEAALRQDKFQPVLEAMLEQQPDWAVHGNPDLERAWQIAGSAGLDVAKARTDATSAEITAVLEQDVADVKANGIQQTPTFYVNGKPLQEFSPQGLYKLVVQEATAAKAGS